MEEIGQYLETLNIDAEIESVAADITGKEEKRLRDEITMGRIQVKHMKKRLVEMREKYEGASRALVIISDELRVFRKLTSYAQQLKRQLEDAKTAYLDTLPCRQKLFHLKIATLEARLDLADQIQNHDVARTG